MKKFQQYLEMTSEQEAEKLTKIISDLKEKIDDLQKKNKQLTNALKSQEGRLKAIEKKQKP